jgi:methionine-rich copper-binding protein CopC
MARVLKNTMIFAGIAIVSLAGVAANAHPELKAADPPVGGSIADSPKEIRIGFSENVLPKFSGIELRDQSGRLMATATATTDTKDKRQLVIPVQETLAPGRYIVDWHAVSADTHRVQGHFSFEVQR